MINTMYHILHTIYQIPHTISVLCLPVTISVIGDVWSVPSLLYPSQRYVPDADALNVHVREAASDSLTVEPLRSFIEHDSNVLSTQGKYFQLRVGSGYPWKMAQFRVYSCDANIKGYWGGLTTGRSLGTAMNELTRSINKLHIFSIGMCYMWLQ